MDYRLQDIVSVRGVKGWIRMKSYTSPALYRVQTDRALLPEMTADNLILVERHSEEERA